MLSAALSGALQSVPMRADPTFRVLVPESCPAVPAEMLDARGQWAKPADYDRAAADLAGRFRQNFEKFSGVAREIAQAAPVAP
jgi:phosphoenolpyruvate carboxykinase (ATP)